MGRRKTITLNVGDTFTYEGVTYKAEKANIVITDTGDTYEDCKGCALLENFKCLSINDIPTCMQETPIIFVKV